MIRISKIQIGTALLVVGMSLIGYSLLTDDGEHRHQPSPNSDAMQDAEPDADTAARTGRLLSAAASLDKPAIDDRKADHCDADETKISIQYYRKLAPQEWRNLNDWQREHGLSQTRLSADGELTQEPSPYLYYDIDTLAELARSDDADARYWLAMKYRESGQPTATVAGNRGDTSMVIPRLLNTAATLGHVQAMQAISNGFYQQAVNASGPNPATVDAFPDLQIKARAWQHVAAWRMGKLPDRASALPADLEQQASQLAAQLITDIEHEREQQGLPPLDNVVPAVLIGLLQVIDQPGCETLSPNPPIRLSQR